MIRIGSIVIGKVNKGEPNFIGRVVGINDSTVKIKFLASICGYPSNIEYIEIDIENIKLCK